MQAVYSSPSPRQDFIPFEVLAKKLQEDLEIAASSSKSSVALDKADFSLLHEQALEALRAYRQEHGLLKKYTSYYAKLESADETHRRRIRSTMASYRKSLLRLELLLGARSRRDERMSSYRSKIRDQAAVCGTHAKRFGHLVRELKLSLRRKSD